jgi:hypothetical protein
MDRLNKKAWEEPKLVVHGDVVRITQSCTDKQYGSSDGMTFMGVAITCRNAS